MPALPWEDTEAPVQVYGSIWVSLNGVLSPRPGATHFISNGSSSSSFSLSLAAASQPLLA